MNTGTEKPPIRFNPRDFLNPDTLIVLLLIVSFIVRILYQSRWLDCWDSVQFTMAMSQYSVSAHLPHPPGFPVYIGMAKLADFFLQDPVQSLILLSIICGVASIYLTYILGTLLSNKYAGLVAALLIAIAPATMQFGVIVMADIVNLCFILLVLTLIIPGLSNKWFFFAGSFVLGLSFGIRPTDSLILAAGIFIVLALFKIKKFKEFFAGIAAGFLLWFLPFITLVDFQEFLDASRAHASMASEVSSYSLGGFGKAVADFFDCLMDGWSISIIIILAVMLVALLVFIAKKNSFRTIGKSPVLIGIWSILFTCYCLVSLYLYTPRYILPLFPVIAIYFGASLAFLYESSKNESAKNPSKTIIVLAAILLVVLAPMGSSSFSIIHGLHTLEPAPVAAASFINSTYQPANTTIFAQESFRHFQYYLPGYSIIQLPGIPDRTLIDSVEKSDVILSEKSLAFSGTPLTFTRDRSIYPKHETVKLYVYPVSSQHTWTLNGWHNLENWNGVPTAWISDNATLLYYSDENRTLNLSLKARSFLKSRTLTISHGTTVQTYPVSPSFASISLPLQVSPGANIIAFSVPEGCERPIERAELQNNDTRCLGIAFQNVTLE